MKNNKLFVYGILKRNYELDLSNYGATFISEACISGAVLYGIGRRWRMEVHPNDGREWSGVGLKLHKDPGGVAHGELWEIPDTLWDWLDSIEQNGFCYTRKIIPVVIEKLREPVERTEGGVVTTLAALQRTKYLDAWVYEYSYPGFSYDNPIKGGSF